MPIGYRLENLGRPAIFKIPAAKVTPAVIDRILEFLRQEYGGSSHTPQVQSGVHGEWQDAAGKTHCEENWIFEVSFLGKERIPKLCQFLAELAVELHEECVYITLGEETRLIFPITQEAE